MKTATIRQVQHNLKDVLRWVADGEEVQIVRRRVVVAKLVSADQPTIARERPDFAARAARVWKRPARGKSVSRLIVDEREDRL